MASKGIRDQVAIVGMGCTPFGEHWDTQHGRHAPAVVDAEALKSAGRRPRRRRRLLARHDGFGVSGLTLSRPLKIDYKPVTRVENMLRHGLGGLPQRVLRGGVGRLRRRDGDRRREAEGLGLLRPRRRLHPQRRHTADADGAGVVQPPRSRLRQEVRRGRGRDERRPHPHRLEEPPQRGAEPAGPVPQGGGEGHHRLLAARGRAARDLRLLWCDRRLGGRHHRARRGRRTSTPTSPCT